MYIAVFAEGEDTYSVEPIYTYESIMSGGKAYYSFGTTDAGTFDIYAVIDMDNSSEFNGPVVGDRINPAVNTTVSANVSDFNFLEEDFSNME